MVLQQLWLEESEEGTGEVEPTVLEENQMLSWLDFTVKSHVSKKCIEEASNCCWKAKGYEDPRSRERQ